MNDLLKILRSGPWNGVFVHVQSPERGVVNLPVRTDQQHPSVLWRAAQDVRNPLSHASAPAYAEHAQRRIPSIARRVLTHGADDQQPGRAATHVLDARPGQRAHGDAHHRMPPIHQRVEGGRNHPPAILYEGTDQGARDFSHRHRLPCLHVKPEIEA